MMKKALVVDDERTVRDVLVQFLEMSNYEVYPACNGVEALQFFEERNPDIVISDLLMPEMDGYELCTEVRKRSEDIPILMLSGQVDLECEQKRMREMGLNITEMLSKPIGMAEFLEHVEAICPA